MLSARSETDGSSRYRSPPLAAALGALTDLPTRRLVLREKIVANPVATARAIDVTLRAAMNGSSPARDATMALASTLVAMLEEGAAGAIEALREAALADGVDAVAALLVDAPAHRALPTHGRLAEVCLRERHDLRFWPEASEREMHWAYLSMLRVSHLPRVLMHPSPIFIGRVLDRKWLKLRHALFIASRRPTSAAIVHEIVRRERWLRRIEIREALVTNPFSPTPVVLCLLPTTRYPVLRHLRDAGAAHPAVARAAGLLIGLRGGARD